jgi:hypothetical protein
MADGGGMGGGSMGGMSDGSLYGAIFQNIGNMIADFNRNKYAKHAQERLSDYEKMLQGMYKPYIDAYAQVPGDFNEFWNSDRGKNFFTSDAAQFKAPTSADMTSDPGYQFRVQQGQEGVENSQAARGGALSGNALRGIEAFRQGLGSQEYGNVYNRRFNEHRDIIQNRNNQLGDLSNLTQVGIGNINALAGHGTPLRMAESGFDTYIGEANAIMATDTANVWANYFAGSQGKQDAKSPYGGGGSQGGGGGGGGGMGSSAGSGMLGGMFEGMGSGAGNWFGGMGGM